MTIPVTQIDSLAIIQDLTELIEAIDRRAPQLERSGESSIANAAARLRSEARARIIELEAINDGQSIEPQRR